MTVPIYLIMNSVWVSLMGVAIGITLEIFHYKKHYRFINYYTKHFLQVKKYVTEDIQNKIDESIEKNHLFIQDTEKELLFLHPRIDQLFEKVHKLEESNQQLIKIIEYQHQQNQRLHSELEILKKEHQESCDIWYQFMDHYKNENSVKTQDSSSSP